LNQPRNISTTMVIARAAGRFRADSRLSYNSYRR
jgi:hypothetical protein